MLFMMLILSWNTICPFCVLNFQSHSLAHCIKVATPVEQLDTCSQSNCLIEQVRIYWGLDVIVYRQGYFTVHGPKFSNSENCCGSENAMPPKIFWDMEGHRGHFRSKNVFFSENLFWKKFIINHTIFLIFRYAFLDTNAVIQKNQKYLLKCVCIYRKNNPNGKFLQVSKFVLH